ncbi:hypothetical protein DOY81_007961, partial [Sarcophaga bullata]
KECVQKRKKKEKKTAKERFAKKAIKPTTTTIKQNTCTAMSALEYVAKAKAFVCLTSLSFVEITFVTAILLLPMPVVKATSGLRVPTFLQEPPSRLLFSNDTGTQISCTAHGNPPPVISWVLTDGTMATQVPGLR